MFISKIFQQLNKNIAVLIAGGITYVIYHQELSKSNSILCHSSINEFNIMAVGIPATKL